MRNIPYQNRIDNFILTHLERSKLEEKSYRDYPVMHDPLLSPEAQENLRDLNKEDLIDVWWNSRRLYLQNIGLQALESCHECSDGIRLHHPPTPAFQVPIPISYRTRDELQNGLIPMYVFQTENKSFESKQHLIDYIVSQLVIGKEVFLFSVDKSPLIFNPVDFSASRKLMVRMKVVDWGLYLNRTDFSFLKVKKNFTPTKNIPKFTM